MADVRSALKMPGAQVTREEIQTFIDDWFEKLDVHAAVEEVLPLVADDGLVMRFPETTAHGQNAFIEWYTHAINTFFDEVHTIEAIRITPATDGGKVEMILKWEPSIWQPPTARTTRMGFLAAQTWELKRAPATDRLQIVTYNVDYFIPLPGMPEL